MQHSSFSLKYLTYLLSIIFNTVSPQMTRTYLILDCMDFLWEINL